MVEPEIFRLRACLARATRCAGLLLQSSLEKAGQQHAKLGNYEPRPVWLASGLSMEIERQQEVLAPVHAWFTEGRGAPDLWRLRRCAIKWAAMHNLAEAACKLKCLLKEVIPSW